MTKAESCEAGIPIELPTFRCQMSWETLIHAAGALFCFLSDAAAAAGRAGCAAVSFFNAGNGYATPSGYSHFRWESIPSSVLGCKSSRGDRI